MSVFKTSEVTIVTGSEEVGSMWFTVETRNYTEGKIIRIGTGKYDINGKEYYTRPYSQLASADDCRKAAEFFTKLANVMEGKE